MPLRVKRLAHGLGAEVTGLDLNDDVPASTVAEVGAAWLNHQKLVFPQQDVSAARHIAFSRQLGKIDPVSFGPLFRHPDPPEHVLISNKSQKGKPSKTHNQGRQWHSDTSFTLNPPTGSLSLPSGDARGRRRYPVRQHVLGL